MNRRLRPLVSLAAAAVFAAVGLAMANASPARPLVTEPAGGVRPGSPMVIFYSGDGGWAAADRGIAGGLARRGLPVVGVDCLHAFAPGRSSSHRAARDLAAAMDHYGQAWGARDVVLVGYSFGASALPLILQQLPPQAAARIRLVALLSPPAKGELAVGPWSWLDIPLPGAKPIAPLLTRTTYPTLCIYGRSDRLAACPALPAGATLVVNGGHRLRGQYDAVAAAIADASLKAAQPRSGPGPGPASTAG